MWNHELSERCSFVQLGSMQWFPPEVGINTTAPFDVLMTWTSVFSAEFQNLKIKFKAMIY